jgi:AAA domain, putative AbiEii toxin, Type IV TA system
MITRIVISNYRSLGENVEVRLGKLTALVGPNGSGKSNVVDALKFVRDALRSGLDEAIRERPGFASLGRWSEGGPLDVKIQIEVESAGEQNSAGTYIIELTDPGDGACQVKREFGWYRFDLPRPRDVLDLSRYAHDAESVPVENSFEVIDGVWKSGPEDLRPSVDKSTLVLPRIAADRRFFSFEAALRDLEVYSISPDTLRKPQRQDLFKPMDRYGGNWCSILKDLKPESLLDLKAAIGHLVGDIDDIRVLSAGSYLFTGFRHGVVNGREKLLDAAQESDGTLRVAGILTALLQAPTLSLIGIEEPELAIYPGALRLLYDFLEEASMRGQVVITTHSPDLVERLNADDIRVVERHDGVTCVSEIDEWQRESVRDRLLTLGELMRMEGLRPKTSQAADGTGG